MDRSICHCLLNSATRFVYVQTVVKLTAGKFITHFRKIMRNLLFGNIHQSKFPHTGSIDYSSAQWKIKHFGKCSGMLSFAAPSANFLCLQFYVRKDEVK